jgi:two-component system chemotaxis sensor kinase CheA
VLSRRLLLVTFKDQIYALPTESVARVLRVDAGDLVTIEGRPAVRRADSTLPLVSLGEVLGLGDRVVTSDPSGICVVVVRAGAAGSAGFATHLGIAVEGFVGVNDFVVRNVDTGKGDQRLWAGIIGTEDGSPCLVLNPGAFMRQEFGSSDIVFRDEKREADRAKVVLVVDDSITTRTLEKSILEAHGYEVRLSVDVRNALAVLRSDRPDIVVSDIEMPHVDGFELVRVMKGDKALADIPIILVTSRSDDEDREKGLRLGADAYVVKQKFDQNELLRTIRQII